MYLASSTTSSNIINININIISSIKIYITNIIIIIYNGFNIIYKIILNINSNINIININIKINTKISIIIISNSLIQLVKYQSSMAEKVGQIFLFAFVLFCFLSFFFLFLYITFFFFCLSLFHFFLFSFFFLDCIGLFGDLSLVLANYLID